MSQLYDSNIEEGQLDPTHKAPSSSDSTPPRLARGSLAGGGISGGGALGYSRLEGDPALLKLAPAQETGGLVQADFATVGLLAVQRPQRVCDVGRVRKRDEAPVPRAASVLADLSLKCEHFSPKAWIYSGGLTPLSSNSFMTSWLRKFDRILARLENSTLWRYPPLSTASALAP